MRFVQLFCCIIFLPLIIGESKVLLQTPTQPNIVFIMTDDQRYDTLFAMPILQEKLVSRGVTFDNAFVSTSVCCPARSSVLSGAYVHNTLVLSNGQPNGGHSRFKNTPNTMAVKLDGAGYTTGMVGKYMNGYPSGTSLPGWDYLSVLPGVYHPDWYNIDNVTFLDELGFRVEDMSGQYLTEFHQERALKFIEESPEPYFLYLMPYAPHVPSHNAPQDDGLFDTFTYTPPADDLSDKPAWVQNWAGGACDVEDMRKQLRSLQAVDRMIGAIVDQVEAQGQLDNTMFVFTSDNGYHWGEHGLPCDKGTPYDDAIRVPLVVSIPGGAQNVTSTELAVMNLDMAPTIYELAGITAQTDGVSLVTQLQGSTDPIRDCFQIEGYDYLEYKFSSDGIWWGTRCKNMKFVEWANGEQELYDLATDPHELHNRLAGAQWGLKITTQSPLEICAGQEFHIQLAAHGGGQHVFLSPNLPGGVTLSDSGMLSGTVNQSFAFLAHVWSPDAIAWQANKPMKFNKYLDVNVVC